MDIKNDWNKKRSFTEEEFVLACDGVLENWELTDFQISKIESMKENVEALIDIYEGEFLLRPEYENIWEYISLHIGE